MDDENGPRCPLSRPSHPHTLSHRYAADYCRFGCFTCGVKQVESANDGSQYYCTKCDVEFHQDCPHRPRKIIHTYHLQHTLTLTYRNPETRTISSSASESKGSDDVRFEYVEIPLSQSDVIFKKCTWCGQDLKGDWFYRCSICTFCLDLSCADTVPPLTIPNPKNHPHSLLFFPRPILTPCDACGLVNVSGPSYVCLQCNYVAHQSCIDLPRVIKLTRHSHRLFHTPHGSPEISSCGVCYKKVDIKYGQYSCSNHDDCSYVVHSKCATLADVWDGRELEWETEESSDNEAEDIIAPFRKLGDDFIMHFGHKHRLKLKKHDGVRDTEKQCRACVFPIVSPQFYHCRKCNYSLHELCAGLPRKLDHALHRHTLFLDTSPLKEYTSMYCSACSRASTGFRYICSKEGCKFGFVLDVRCISVSECFVHKSHESHDHPVFISTSSSSSDEILCKGCKKTCFRSHLKCTECEFALCYTCGTIPYELHYKYDKHLLTLSYGETTEDVYWCEVCEKQLDPREWFYTCNQCCTTVHLQCVFGSSVFMKPGSIFRHRNGVVKVFRNSSNTRQICYKCKKLCTDSIYYEGFKWGKTQVFYNDMWTFRIVFCSLHCIEMRKW